MKYQLIILFLHLLALLPLRVSRALAWPVARCCQLTNSRMWQTTRINLQLCFPDLAPVALDALARQSLHETLQTIMESAAVWLWPPGKALAMIEAQENVELLQEACARGKGVIVLAPHLGNWELLGLYLNCCGLGQSYQLYQAPEHSGLNKLIYQARSRAGARMVATDSKGVAELLKALRAGSITGILPDQVPPDESGEFVPFFGIPALTMTLLVRLQQKTGATVLVAWVQREQTPAGKRLRLVFREPDSKIYASDMPTALAGMNKSIEQAVREVPAQYQWEYKRFRRQPEGRNRPY